MSVLSIVLMICSNNFWMIALAIGVNALSYNLASGTREALALLIAVATVVLAFKLVEITEYKSEKAKNASLRAQFKDCVVSSVRFLKENPRCIAIIALNSVVGAILD